MIPDGIILIDKPAGMTSHGAVSRLRKLLGVRRIGHGGTLDPPASGLLVVLVGRATRLAPYLGGGTKVYATTIRFGAATDTDDAAGETTAIGPVPALDLDELAESRRRFLGDIEQVPPTISAVHAGGERAWRVARRGRTVELAPRTVSIHAIDLVRWAPPDLEVRVTCGGGTYVRSLARDWGASLGTVAHVASLRRERSAPFDVSEAVTLAELEGRDPSGRVEVIRPPGPALTAAIGAAETLAVGAAQRFVHGGQPDGVPGPPGLRAVFTEDGAFVGVGELRPDGTLCPRVVWPPSGERAP